MYYNITCPTKILTLAIAPFLFISVSVLCKFALVSDVYIVPLSLQETVMHSSS